MTTDDRLERVLPDLLANAAPMRAPDGLRRDVLSRTGHIRPRPGWLAHPTHSLRFQTMSSTLKIAAVAAVALVVGVAIGPVLAPPGPNLVSDPTASPAPSPSVGPVPAVLQNEWVGSRHAIEGLDIGAAPVLKLTGTGFSLIRPWDRSFPGVMTSVAGITADNLIELTTTVAADGCAVGDVGRYRWAYVERDLRLTIDPGTDACQRRAQLVPGSWIGWGTGCEPGQWCLGDLDAGSHASSWFSPRSPSADAAAVRLGALSYVVPDGWANTLDDNNHVILTRGDRASVPANSYPDAIRVFARPAALDSAAGCPVTADPSVGRTVADLAAYVEHHPGLVVSDSQPITIDGHPGYRLDVDIAPTWTTTCVDQPGTGPFVGLFGDWGSLDLDLRVGDEWWWGAGELVGSSVDPMRIVLLDIGKGDTVLVIIDSQDTSGQAALLDQAMPIVESFRFAD